MNIQNNNRQFQIGTKIVNIINGRRQEGTIVSFNNNKYKIYYEEDEYHQELSRDEVARCINGESRSSIQNCLVQTTMNNKVLSAIDSEEFGDNYPCPVHEGCLIITFQNTGSQRVSAFHPKTIETSNAF